MRRTRRYGAGRVGGAAGEFVCVGRDKVGVFVWRGAEGVGGCTRWIVGRGCVVWGDVATFYTPAPRHIEYWIATACARLLQPVLGCYSLYRTWGSSNAAKAREGHADANATCPKNPCHMP